jgi:hypothetical protein
VAGRDRFFVWESRYGAWTDSAKDT